MDVTATMKELGIAEDAYRVLGFLPLVYVAWADGKIQRAERKVILETAERLGWLAGGGDQVLERWLTERPTDADVKKGVALLNHLAGDRDQLDTDLDADSLRLLLLLCRDVANAAGKHLGFGDPINDDEATALEAIAGQLDVENARTWRDLQD